MWLESFLCLKGLGTDSFGVKTLDDIHSCLSLLHLEFKMCHKDSVQYVILSKTDKMFNWYVY